jgi:hypothetical protein
MVKRLVLGKRDKYTGLIAKPPSLLALQAYVLAPFSQLQSLYPENGGSKILQKQWYLTITLYSVISQKTSTSMFTAMKTPNLKVVHNA